MLDALAEEGKLVLEGNLLTIPGGNRPSFALEPACRILRTADGGPDPHGLVGAVRSERALREMQAEVYLDSVVFRETAYQTEPGYIGEEKELLEKLGDTELLARYLLENLL